MKKFLLGFLALLLVVVIAAGAMLIYGINSIKNQKEDIADQVQIEKNEFGTIVAVDRGLYDQDGNRFEIKGINFGNLFIAEGWMTVNSIGAAYNDDGSFKSVNDQGIVEEYKEIYQEEMDQILADRVAKGDFTEEQLKELNDAYFYAYCTEADFKLISDTGINTIRLPMYYRNFMEGSDEALTMREDAFEKLDYFLELAKKYDLKVIIYMHGVVGGQSGFEHSGTPDIDFWDTEIYIQEMCTLWKNIALHYVNDRADLASTILAFDLVNEPTKKHEAATGRLQWDVMDRMYDAIREVDTHHLITIEGVWYPDCLPDPAEYGWENVIYQYHFYNWNHDKGVSNKMFYSLMMTLYAKSNYNVPKLVGEFNFFGDRDSWDEYLGMYDDLGWGWTIWSYKIVSVGYWDSSWGLVVNKLNLQNDMENTAIEDYKLKLDLRTASYEEILSVWSAEYTKYDGQDGVYRLYRDGMLYNVLKDYFGEEFLVDKREISR